MNDMQKELFDLGFGEQVAMSSFINALDDRFGEGSGNRNEDGKSWGEVTNDKWIDDPSMQHICDGNQKDILLAYAELRRAGNRGWANITTDDWEHFSLWKPVSEAARN